jgi:hypothetical protein
VSGPHRRANARQRSGLSDSARSARSGSAIQVIDIRIWLAYNSPQLRIHHLKRAIFQAMA